MEKCSSHLYDLYERSSDWYDDYNKNINRKKKCYLECKNGCLLQRYHFVIFSSCFDTFG